MRTKYIFIGITLIVTIFLLLVITKGGKDKSELPVDTLDGVVDETPADSTDGIDSANGSTGALTEWGNQRRITIQGFDRGAEIGVSPDESMIFFNDPGGNKNLHWATRIDDTTYQYQGEIQNVNTDKVDASPVMDANGKIYYTWTKNYPREFETMFVADFENGRIVNPQPLTGDIYVEKVGWVNLDTAVSPKCCRIACCE